jgi:hypothetical protein
VYVSGSGAGADALHLRGSGGAIVGRFVSGARAYLLEGWLEEPVYTGMLMDPEAAHEGIMAFVAAPIDGGMRLSLFAMDEEGELDLERPLREYALQLAPGRAPQIPAELLASLGLEGEALSGDAEEADGDGAGATDAGAAPGSGGTGPFHGPFHGDDGRGGLALLRFVQQGERLQGEIVAFGASARLAGTASGNTAAGQVQASDAGGTFKATLAANAMDITFVLRGENGEASLPMRLERGEPKGERDPRLIGTWVKSSSYTSGDFSVATSQTCVIRPDGTLTLFDSEMAGGGDAGSFSSGPAQGGITHRWHTRDNLLYVDGQLYARFGFSGETLGLWFSENGKPEIWSRR